MIIDVYCGDFFEGIDEVGLTPYVFQLFVTVPKMFDHAWFTFYHFRTVGAMEYDVFMDSCVTFQFIFLKIIEEQTMG